MTRLILIAIVLTIISILFLKSGLIFHKQVKIETYS